MLSAFRSILRTVQKFFILCVDGSLVFNNIVYGIKTDLLFITITSQPTCVFATDLYFSVSQMNIERSGASSPNKLNNCDMYWRWGHLPSMPSCFVSWIWVCMGICLVSSNPGDASWSYSPLPNRLYHHHKTVGAGTYRHIYTDYFWL